MDRMPEMLIKLAFWRCFIPQGESLNLESGAVIYA